MSDTGPSAGAQHVLALLLEARSGQQLGANRAWRLEAALRPVVRDLGLETLEQLVLKLLDGSAPLLADQVVDALLNQETSFFRDTGVLELAAESVASDAGRPRIWCAGCSTGQEPYSLAMLFAERGGAMPEVIASDLSEPALARARSGRFNQFEIQRGLPIRRMMRWFDEQGGDWVAKPELVRYVAFRRHNLMVDPAPAGQFDLILCRNVLFYFGAAPRRQVLLKLAGALKPGGVLVLGAGETVIGQSDAFQPSARWRGLYEAATRPVPLRAAVG